MDPMQCAVKALFDGGFSCAVFDGEGLAFTSLEKGVRPLMDALAKDPSGLRQKYVADRIIGKAAACILIVGGAAACYGQVMSLSAIEILSPCMPYSFGITAPVIQNRDKTGLCPMENAVLTAKTAHEGYEILKSILK